MSPPETGASNENIPFYSAILAIFFAKVGEFVV